MTITQPLADRTSLLGVLLVTVPARGIGYSIRHMIGLRLGRCRARPPQKADPSVFQETPIFNRLVAERGDVPAQARGEADRVRHELAQVLPSAAWPVAHVLRQQPQLPGGNISSAVL
ncbi:hypothetical protein [Streptomyces sp. CoH27]|uniref:hypothetical protein n=1 Tax=Streptomyces sp. CoH27 TaxID=2875763 RepID=UPI001CD1A014|nr:hypothetical protein [Streptomyces sp. CoH27]